MARYLLIKFEDDNEASYFIDEIPHIYDYDSGKFSKEDKLTLVGEATPEPFVEFTGLYKVAPIG